MIKLSTSAHVLFLDYSLIPYLHKTALLRDFTIYVAINYMYS